MSLAACIAELIDKGELDADQGAYLNRLRDKLNRRLLDQLGEDAAGAVADGEALDAAIELLAKRKQRALLQTSRKLGALDDIGRYRGRKGKWDDGRAAEALLVRDERAPYSNAEYKERTIRQRALGRLADMVEHHGRNIAGVLKDKAGAIDILREAFYEKSGNDTAKAFAEGWLSVTEDLRMRANAAGADIGKIDRWGLPQWHDPAAVRLAAGPGAEMADAYAAWRSAEVPRLGRDKMLDFETGKPLDDDGFEEVLRHAFDSIVTDGWAHRDPGAGGAPSIAARMSAGRVLIYKDAESWLASHAQFGGSAGIYDVMMGHIHSMARDIALMERLGPNPAATVRWLKDMVEQKANVEQGAGSVASEAAFKSARRIQGYFDSLSGENRRPESRRLAAAGEAIRAWQVSTKLGSAALSTTSDVATGALSRAYNDLPMGEIVTGYAKYLNPANHADRMHAQRTGFVAEQQGSSLAGTARMMAEEMAGNLSRRLAEGTLRLSALNAITEAGRWTHGMGTLSHITRERAKAFDALDDGFRGMFERHGLGADAWDAIRATEPEMHEAGEWITPDLIKNQRLADRLMEMIYQEMDVAVPTSGVATRAMLDRVAPKGTWTGETIRTAFQFKAFPITLMMVQWQRAMARETGFDRLAAFAMFFGASALAGAFALQMKEVAKGRNARPMGNAGFFLEAVAQGGGAGIYGDFVRSTESRFNSGPWQVLAGPAMQTAANLGTLTVGNAVRAAKGERTHVQSDLHKLVRSETPLVGSLWYTRLAYERAALDSWRRASNPMAAAQDAQTEHRYARDYGQDYWWRPGHDAPEGLPELGDAFGSGPPPKAPSHKAGW